MKLLYYRGLLKSCNYRCYYCPFAKSETNVSKDEFYLNKFCKFIANIKSLETVFFVPYGEALIHDYYLENFYYLSKSKIKKIICQTNLSFDVNHFIEILKEGLQKMSLSCSFHPTQIEAKSFADKCEILYKNNIKFSVGAVGDYKNINQMKELKKILPKDIYFWVNAIEYQNTTYSADQIEEFKKIDPHFCNEIKNIKSDYKDCYSGKSAFFVNYKGDLYNCNLDRQKLGNLYLGEIKKAECKKNLCSCYLAYSNRINFKDFRN